MKRFIYFFVLFLGFTTAAQAKCTGINLIDAMPPDARIAFDAKVNAQPFPRGNFWRAEKNGQNVFIQGTFHMADTRHQKTMKRIAPYIKKSEVIYLEATRKEVKQLKTYMAENPGIIFVNEGPTLPELLSDELWQRFSAEMKVRGIPAVLASKFRPGYAMMMLGIPPCALDFSSAATPKGLDVIIQNFAWKHGLKTASLEPYDTMISIFSLLEEGDPIEALRLGLAMTNEAVNNFITLREGYFLGEHGAIWEHSRQTALETPGIDPETLKKDFEKFERVTLTDRNLAWMDLLRKSSDLETIFVAVGAAHLSNENGLLNLLAQDGYTLYPLD